VVVGAVVGDGAVVAVGRGVVVGLGVISSFPMFSPQAQATRNKDIQHIAIRHTSFFFIKASFLSTSYLK
jgi:hypothetical protein